MQVAFHKAGEQQNQVPSSLSEAAALLLAGPPIVDGAQRAREMWIDEDLCLQWVDRSESHVLSSGLDDYPRGLFVNPAEECHLDAHVWFMFLVDSMDKMCKAVMAVSMPDEATKDLMYAAHSSYCAAYDYPSILGLLRKGLGKRFYDKDRKIFSDFAGAATVREEGKDYFVPPLGWFRPVSPAQVGMPRGAVLFALRVVRKRTRILQVSGLCQLQDTTEQTKGLREGRPRDVFPACGIREPVRKRPLVSSLHLFCPFKMPLPKSKSYLSLVFVRR